MPLCWRSYNNKAVQPENADAWVGYIVKIRTVTVPASVADFAYLD